MTVESFLTRELDIRFIDARRIAAEARVSLGIHGYPSKDELRALRREAMRLFEERPENVKMALRELNNELEELKSCGSNHSRDSDSECSVSSC